MKVHNPFKKISKYGWIETIFFTLFFFAFPIITDIEYAMKEQPCQGCEQSFSILLLQRIIWGLFQIPVYLLLYKLIIGRLLIQKKYLLFFFAYLLFLFGLDVYNVHVQYWSIARLTFLPEYITSTAAKWYKVKTFFHFSIIYIIQQTLVFIALAYFINYTKQEIKLKALKQAKLESDLNYLKAQLQPHFFFNTLNNIYSLAQQQSADTAPLVSKLSEMMRYIIYETSHSKVTLKKEIEFLQNYVEVQSIRYNKNIRIQFDTQGITEIASIEPLLLLPFVENAFKHGIEEEAISGFVTIVIMLAGNELIVQISNSKPGKSLREGLNGAGGLGLQNARQRLDLLYPEKYHLTIKDTTSQFEIVLTLYLS
ncbi:MAG: sensor histidine kinase [Chitinophagaceae bacterium]